MNRFEAWAVHLGNLLVGLTGLVYAWMRYLLSPADPYAVVNHPWQPAVQHAHVLAAPLLVFACGLIWRHHAWKQLATGVPVRRRSGLALLLTLAPMVASAYLLQTAVDPAWHRAWVWLHLASSGLWLVGSLAHLLAPSRPRSR
ncbi:MAG: hypothetical protein U0002_01875 [Thermoanaerobaculia bacterium]